MRRSTRPAQYGRIGVVVCMWIGSRSHCRKASRVAHSLSRMYCVAPLSFSTRGSAPGIRSLPVELRSNSSPMWPGVPFTFRVTSVNAASKPASVPGLICANTITRVGISVSIGRRLSRRAHSNCLASHRESARLLRPRFDIRDHVIHHHARRLPQLPQRRSQRVLAGTALKSCECLPILPVASNHEGGCAGAVAEQRLSKISRFEADPFGDRLPHALEFLLASGLHLHVQSCSHHIASHLD